MPRAAASAYLPFHKATRLEERVHPHVVDQDVQKRVHTLRLRHIGQDARSRWIVSHDLVLSRDYLQLRLTRHPARSGLCMFRSFFRKSCLIGRYGALRPKVARLSRCAWRATNTIPLWLHSIHATTRYALTLRSRRFYNACYILLSEHSTRTLISMCNRTAMQCNAMADTDDA